MSISPVHVLMLGATRLERMSAARALVASGGTTRLIELPAAALPFRHPHGLDKEWAHEPITLLVNDLENSFPNPQGAGIRLVLTQSSYLLQRWLDALGPSVRIVLTADRASLRRVAPEAINRRGPWRHFEVISLEDTSAAQVMGEFEAEAEGLPSATPEGSPAEELLIRAFRSPSSDERVLLCREASEAAPQSEVAALALASAYREAGDADGARKAIDRACELAPNWEAVYYEDGKFWLALDDAERARASFQRACELMPGFSAAWSNLGATLGELKHPEAALDAFIHALSHDPQGATILNNIGVVTRELGRLDESESALRQVVTLTPEFVFGHYNLGHTRFLRGDYPGALQAYEEGQRRDSHRNRRQACRLALVRLANHDLEGAERDLWQCTEGASPDEREDLLLEAYEVAEALLANEPPLGAHRLFLERIAAAITR